MENTIFKVVSYETNIKGYWQDNEGKVYIDNILQIKINNAYEFDNELNILFLKGEKAVFVLGSEKAYIIYANGETLALCDEIQETYIGNILPAQIIDEILKNYNGFTAYTENGKVRVSIWK